MPADIKLGSTTLVFDASVSDVDWDSKKDKLTPALTQAFRIAPQMAEVALNRMTSLDCRAKFTALRVQGYPDMAYRETVIALYKYFNFPMDLLERPPEDPFWTYVPRIAAIFEKTLTGLREKHTVRLYSGKVSEHGYVPSGGGMKTALAEYFARIPDEYGHVEFTAEVKTEDIHLNLNWLGRLSPKEDQIARTIVHEATHKWDYTTDECYKSSTIARRYKNSSMNLNHYVGTKAQPKEARPGDSIQKQRLKPKPFIYSMAEEPKNRLDQGQAVETPRWLRNADSYAWCARRLWKRAQGLGEQLDD